MNLCIVCVRGLVWSVKSERLANSLHDEGGAPLSCALIAADCLVNSAKRVVILVSAHEPRVGSLGYCAVSVTQCVLLAV